MNGFFRKVWNRALDAPVVVSELAKSDGRGGRGLHAKPAVPTLAGADGTTLANVSAGMADDDAVGVGQLSPVAGALGGGAAIDPVAGEVTCPTRVLDNGTDSGTTLNCGDVGSALENLGGRMAANTTELDNLIDGTAGLVWQG